MLTARPINDTDRTVIFYESGLLGGELDEDAARVYISSQLDKDSRKEDWKAGGSKVLVYYNKRTMSQSVKLSGFGLGLALVGSDLAVAGGASDLLARVALSILAIVCFFNVLTGQMSTVSEELKAWGLLYKYLTQVSPSINTGV